ncbi:interaptin-like [Periophthalmus magnuspinnatus]|uniref:interaptin-like n=1 Tax=Periophthalmus magnuspinnatus TaxID=409849 RepID=UPI0024364173|nr:interaptin-like [Periophthalmus magnuspinnatus]
MLCFYSVSRSPDKGHKEQLKEVHKAISKLQRDLDTLSAHSLSMKTHQEQLQDREDIIDRYKKQLGASLEREKHLEQRMVQMELEWQKNYEENRSKHYLDHEQLIHELTAARDKVNAELVETKLQLQELTVLLQCVTKERDLALQGCVPHTGHLASDEIIALKQKNYRLQAVISEMRKQMEELSCTTPPRQQPHTELENSVTKEYNGSEKEAQHVEPNITKVKEKQEKSSCVCSCGHISRENSALVQLHSRLKQAALCIARLNRDRQQLIELCNRLRSQRCTFELLNQSNSNTGTNRVNESTNNLKTENYEKEREVYLDPDLLTTQVHSSPSSVMYYDVLGSSVQNNHRPIKELTSAPPNCSQLLQANGQSEDSVPSLSALWALLDQRPSQDLSKDNAEDSVEVHSEVFSGVSMGLVKGGAQMEVCGLRAPVHKQPTAKPPQKRGPLKHTARSARIRNYNNKD